MADYRLPPHQVPRRKPLPGGNSGLQFHSATQNAPQQPPPKPTMPPVSQNQYRPHPPPAQYMNQQPARLGVSEPQPAFPGGNPAPTRRLSSTTASSNSNGGNGPPTRNPSNASGDVHRSSSSRSGGPALSYVAMMRKQKATVWSDRAQPEDPRLVAQKKAARKRANMEIHGSNARTPAQASGSMVGKIRHHGVPKAPGYSPATFVGAGVPMRLSANEVGHAEDNEKPEPTPMHKRTGSGRSSVGSNRFPSGYQRPQQGRFSSSSTPPNAEPGEVRNSEIPEVAEDSLPKETETPSAAATTGATSSINASSDSGQGNRAASTYSFSDDREDSFGAVTEMVAPSGAVAAAQKAKTAEDLKRRGSVDDRTMTMSGVRLYIANPDLSD